MKAHSEPTVATLPYRSPVFAVTDDQSIVRGLLVGRKRGTPLFRVLTAKGVVRTFHGRWVSFDAWGDFIRQSEKGLRS